MNQLSEMVGSFGLCSRSDWTNNYDTLYALIIISIMSKDMSQYEKTLSNSVFI